MNVLMNPFKLLGRLLIAGLQITGYTASFIVQIFGYLYYRQRYMIIDAFGSFGRSVTDAIVGIFKD
ncbi:MAG: hypothetical protein E3K37_03560 [Candidatus Kuenenia sp.]|nr:hypothetical protein [Candidatus Kuenenia hertensis]